MIAHLENLEEEYGDLPCFIMQGWDEKELDETDFFITKIFNDCVMLTVGFEAQKTIIENDKKRVLRGIKKNEKNC